MHIHQILSSLVITVFLLTDVVVSATFEDLPNHVFDKIISSSNAKSSATLKSTNRAMNEAIDHSTIVKDLIATDDGESLIRYVRAARSNASPSYINEFFNQYEFSQFQIGRVFHEVCVHGYTSALAAIIERAEIGANEKFDCLYHSSINGHINNMNFLVNSNIFSADFTVPDYVLFYIMRRNQMEAFLLLLNTNRLRVNPAEHHNRLLKRAYRNSPEFAKILLRDQRVIDSLHMSDLCFMIGTKDAELRELVNQIRFSKFSDPKEHVRVCKKFIKTGKKIVNRLRD